VFPPFNPAQTKPEYGLTAQIRLRTAECSSRTVRHQAPPVGGDGISAARERFALGEIFPRAMSQAPSLKQR
jgi:hypothetical protein